MSVIPFRTGREAPRAARCAMETRIYTVGEIGAWRLPPFQRPLIVNAKVLALAEEVKTEGGIITGVITLGTLKGQPAVIYIVDGQHRLEAFRMSGLPEFISDFRQIEFTTMAEMAEEYERLNTALARMRPDDMLRALEFSVKGLSQIKKECEYVGYDQIRRGTSSPILSMAVLLRCWTGSLQETPQSKANVPIAAQAQALTDETVEEVIRFLTVAHAAWGRDPEYARLWGALNLSLCMWLWHRLIREQGRSGTKRFSTLTIKQFKLCLMALSADGNYLDWLHGRLLRDQDRSPAYGRIKKIFTARLKSEMSGKLRFPSPAWAAK